MSSIMNSAVKVAEMTTKHTYILGCVCVECKKVNYLKDIEINLANIDKSLRIIANKTTIDSELQNISYTLRQIAKNIK